MATHAATLLFVLVYFWVVVITALDFSLFYAVFPYRYFVAAALLALFLLLPGRTWRLKLGLLLILAFWFSVLPRVSWHDESNFFINAGTLRKGMTEEQVRKTMQPFISTASPDGEEITFRPASGSEDACVVRIKAGKAREVTVRHD